MTTTMEPMLENAALLSSHQTLPNLTTLQLTTGWLGSVVVGCRTYNQEVASSTPGRYIAR